MAERNEDRTLNLLQKIAERPMNESVQEITAERDYSCDEGNDKKALNLLRNFGRSRNYQKKNPAVVQFLDDDHRPLAEFLAS